MTPSGSSETAGRPPVGDPGATALPGADRAAIVLWLSLASLALGRAALSFVPGMWLWALNLQRFMDPRPAWTLWTIATLGLVPALARRMAPALTRVGEAITNQAAWAFPIASVLAAALVWWTPDRVWFVGDFLLRQYTLEGKATAVAAWYPHALPLDLFLHDTLGRLLMRDLGMVANEVGRALGAVEAALLGLLAVGFARALKVRGGGAATAAAIVFGGGYLTMYTGYDKAFSEMPLLVAAVGITGLRLVRGEGEPLALGALLAIAFVLHRSAVGLLPAAILAGWLWLIASGGAWRRPTVLVAVILPAAVLAVMLPRLLAIVTRIDPMHFTPDEVRRGGGVLRAAFAGNRPLDLLDLVVMLSPLALAAPALALLLPRAVTRRRELGFLALLALPFVAVMPFLHPGQGYLRDWDDFAASGMALSLVTGWLVARTLEAAPRFAWLAVSASLSAVVPSVQWLVHHTDTARGLARVEAFLHEPPMRTESERTRAWDFLGWRRTDLGDYAGAAAAFARVAEVQPSPRVMRQWAATEALRGDPRRAQEIYRRLLARFPDHATAWFELAKLSYEIGDLDEARSAAGEFLRLRPASEAARAWIAHLDSVRTAHGP